MSALGGTPFAPGGASSWGFEAFVEEAISAIAEAAEATEDTDVIQTLREAAETLREARINLAVRRKLREQDRAHLRAVAGFEPISEEA